MIDIDVLKESLGSGDVSIPNDVNSSEDIDLYLMGLPFTPEYKDLSVDIEPFLFNERVSNELKVLAKKLSEESPLRFGQALFNEAYKVKPDLMREIVGTEKDFFYELSETKAISKFEKYCCI